MAANSRRFFGWFAVVTGTTAALISLSATQSRWNESAARALQSARTSLEQDAQLIALISRVSSLSASLHFEIPESAERLLNQTIQQQPHWRSVRVLDSKLKPFAQNTISPEGFYLNDPQPLPQIDWEQIRFRVSVWPKAGEIEFYIAPSSEGNGPALILSRTIRHDETVVGRLLVWTAPEILLLKFLDQEKAPLRFALKESAVAPSDSNYLFSGLGCDFSWKLSDLILASVYRWLLTFLILQMICWYSYRLVQWIRANFRETERRGLQAAHDLKSPLGVIESITRDFSEIPPSSKHLILESCERIRKIAESVSPGNLHSSCTSIESAMKDLLLEKAAEFRKHPHLKFRSDIETAVRTVQVGISKTEISRILSNLINNAAEAMNHEGEVLMAASKKSEMALIQIQDTGSGIPSGLLARIGKFGASFGKARGTGIGLWSARQTLEAHGGSLSISRLEKGTRVDIYLPCV